MPSSRTTMSVYLVAQYRVYAYCPWFERAENKCKSSAFILSKRITVMLKTMKIKLKFEKLKALF
jgi:hypothetical protein